MRLPSLLVAVALVLGGLTCRQASRQGPATAPCIISGVPREAACLTLSVAENPDEPDGRHIDLWAAIIKAEGSRPLNDPIVIFAGGPGQAASEVAGQLMPLFGPLLSRRDLLVVDQRGTGHSNSLECPDAGVRRPIGETFDVERQRRELVECRQALSARGADLAQYATWIAARDLEAIRVALGYRQLNLWGGSYGTRAALEYLRQYEANVRTITLDGVAPASSVLPVALSFDTDAALDAWSSACDDTKTCADQHLAQSAEGLLRSARDGGIDVAGTEPYFGTPLKGRLEPRHLLGMLRGPLYAPMFAALLPRALQQAKAGDFSTLLALESAMGGGKLSTGMHFSVICAEDMPRLTPELEATLEKTRAQGTLVELYREACEGWPVRAVPEGFYAPLKSAVPSLLLSGGVDPATPPRNADAVARHLSQGLHLVAPSLAHGVSGQSCGPQLIQKFIAKADVAELDGGCLAELPLPPIFSPVEPTP